MSLALAMGWLFGGGEPERVHLMSDLGQPLGCLYQLQDDLEDNLGVADREAKKNGIGVLTTARCKQLIVEQRELAMQALDRAGLQSEPLSAVISNLSDLAAERAAQF
jgi:hypothetical protein